ncbi:MAG: ATP-binding protein [Deltaproteobacteria bacterium]|nr:ATP-binding protein [Deltaproteobacteria bacterium]
MDLEQLGSFYLGRRFDLAAGAATDEPILYDARDLTTHAVCVGMTGSGKTGLCLALLEDALIDGVPVIAIDPKGDLGNLMLTFPDLAPADFAPWMDPATAARDGLTIDQLAAKTAARWRDGIVASGQGVERIARLHAAGDVTIYTPGSEAGVPLSLLKSFAPPHDADDAELWRDRIEAAVSGLCALVGVTADPLRSREHVLLSQLLDHAWRAGRALTLADLVQGVSRPPFDRVGALDLETFYPAKERTELALALNTLIASPSFAAWSTGAPLDLASLLYTPAGRPRIAVLSIAHLSDAERMFFVTVLLQEVIAWMRGQAGTSSLRAILFMDEVAGYLPPVAMPPSKKPMLTLLKQARAFGLGVMVATQNPVDLDYKALANAGTWFVGRLQTERDKARLMDGLEGASAAAGKAFDKAAMEQTLAALGNRMFVMQNVHDDHPVVLQSRFCLSYLAGPLTRPQLQRLTAPAKAIAAAAQATAGVVAAVGSIAGTTSAAAPASGATRPVVPAELPEVFAGAGALAPHLLGRAKVHHVLARKDVDVWRDVTVIAPLAADTAGDFWEHGALAATPATAPSPAGDARYAPLPPALTAKVAARLADGLEAWLKRAGALRLIAAPGLGLVARPDEAEPAFRARVAQAEREARDAAIDTLRSKYRPRLEKLGDKVRAAEARVDREQAQATASTTDSAIAIGTSVFGAIFGSRRGTVGKVASAARRVNRTAQQRGDVARADEALTAIQAQVAELEAELAAEIAAIQAAPPTAIETLDVPARAADTTVTQLALLWRPAS